MSSEDQPAVKRVRVEDGGWNAMSSNYAVQVSKKLFLDEKTADVFFVCGEENEKVPAHKSVLSKSSPVFAAMFYGPNADNCDKQLPGISSDVFKDFLQFCYSDAIILHPDCIPEVMELLHQYQMNESLERCGECWAANMKIDDVCWAYHWAIHFEMAQLKTFCERKISAHPNLVFKTSGFLSCAHVVLDHILQLDTLICAEKLVLESCLEWAKQACEKNGDDTKMDNMRKYLKDSLYKVRYASLTSKEFREVMDSTESLFEDAKDYEEIFRLISGSKDLKTNKFNPDPRSSKFSWDANRVLTHHFKADRTSKTNIERTTVQTILISNRTILLGGILFHQMHCQYNNIDFDSNIIIKDISGKETVSRSQSMKVQGFSDIGFMFPDNPVVIEPSRDYVISFCLKSSNCFFYEQCLDFNTGISLDPDTMIGLKLLHGKFPIKSLHLNLL